MPRRLSLPVSGTATSMTPQSGLMYLPSTVESLGDWLILFHRDFHAHPIQSQVLPSNLDEGPQMNGTSGLKPFDSLVKYSPSSYSLKMSEDYYPQQELAIWNQEAQSWETPQMGLLGMRQRLSGSLVPSGLTHNGRLYQPQRQVRPTNERDGGAGQRNWPTPTASDRVGSGPTIIRRNGKSRMDERLCYATEQDPRNWPTPDESKGRLNPQWVEWLMGLPLGWTALEPLAANAYEYWLNSTAEGTWWDYDPAEVAQPWTDAITPRVVRGMKNRAKRLKSLGNGIVPAVVPAFLQGG